MIVFSLQHLGRRRQRTKTDEMHLRVTSNFRPIVILNNLQGRTMAIMIYSSRVLRACACIYGINRIYLYNIITYRWARCMLRVVIYFYPRFSFCIFLFRRFPPYMPLPQTVFAFKSPHDLLKPRFTFVYMYLHNTRTTITMTDFV